MEVFSQVPPPENPPRRKRKSKNRQGAIITNMTHIQELEQERRDEAAAVLASVTKALAKTRAELAKALGGSLKEKAALQKRLSFLKKYQDAEAGAKANLEAKSDLAKLNSGENMSSSLKDRHLVGR